MADNIQQNIAALSITASGAVSILGYIQPRVSPCANIQQTSEGKDANCVNDGTQSCSRCNLVRVSGSLSMLANIDVSRIDAAPVLQQRLSNISLACP